MRMSAAWSALALAACGGGPGAATRPESFAEAIRGGGALVLHEGLPHQRFEAHLLASERAAKPVTDLFGYPFYAAPVPLGDADASALRKTLGNRGAYETWSGEKKCGGFHPDWSVEVPGDGVTWHALVCFGCREVKTYRTGAGWDLATREDIEPAAYDALKTVLPKLRTNRPRSE
ncbi:MAG: hypothetical protein HMLKMBBP_02293 [Planctomycetes bacterium]|nr:hypothetical protein [Planctomycetota bacterium]